MSNIEAHCHSCGQKRPFRHMHDTAHGIPGTHMAGSERFECSACGETIHAGDNDGQFTFILDKPE
ncbi:hypothetical protein [Mesorhizobium sp. KR9-304]|uniref:hypothetical protein n=1 Tax=Mesorhizobium sp. KR9-304 TaxID=3156614 RepID=UPI0032B5E165